MLTVTDDLSFLDENTTLVTALGYEALGEFGIPERRYFRKNNCAGKHTHQIHAFQVDSPHITRFLAFRDYLIAHPAVACEYDMPSISLQQCSPRTSETTSIAKIPSFTTSTRILGAMEKGLIT